MCVLSGHSKFEHQATLSSFGVLPYSERTLHQIFRERTLPEGEEDHFHQIVWWYCYCCLICANICLDYVVL